MMNRETLYERNLTGSFMKLTSGEEGGFDSAMLLRKKLPGLLPMEKCYVNQCGEYWYNISGKQSLDTYCQIRNVGIEFIEQVIISICSEIEILDRNLIRADCLLLEPGQIFVENRSREIIFAAYPEEQETLSEKFRQLMEYLLTKIDHKDQEAVRTAYGLYEKTLDEGYSVMDIRDFIIKERMDSAVETEPVAEVKEREQTKETFGLQRLSRDEKVQKPGKASNSEPLQSLYLRLREIWENWRNSMAEKLPRKSGAGGKEEHGAYVYPEIVYPEACGEAVAERQESYPTICLNSYPRRPEGILIYEGRENYEDIRLEGELSTIGKGDGVDAEIRKDTISHLHARIRCEGGEYYIEDLNSTNGTYVNDNLLCYKEKRMLKSNDVIRFADVKYRFV
jgi:hypothetical protein